MSQSWDNVANMHEFIFTVNSHTQRKSKQYHLPSCISTVSTHDTLRMQHHELWTYYFVDHTPRCRSIAAAQTHHCNGDVLALLKRRIYHHTMTKNRPRLLLRSSEARWHVACMLSRPLEMHDASRHSFENASLWAPLFVHMALQFWSIVGLLNL